MKRILLSFIMIGVCSALNSQIITIKDAETREPLELAYLTNENNKVFTGTNSKGQADISDFKNETKIMIRLFGYKTEIRSYTELESAGEFFLIPTGINMEEILVSANRRNQLSKNIPSKITVISPKLITLQNPQTAADLLTLSGKVFIQKSQQGGGSPMIRGFATNRLVYTVDGVRMNTAIFRAGNIQNVISIDPFAIEDAEVFFGPGSVIYGSDAIGGVMSFQTLTPNLSLNDKPLVSGKSVIRFSSANNEKTGHFSVNVGRKKWAWVTSFSYNDYDDLKMGGKGPDEYLKPYYVARQDSVDVIRTNENPLVQTPSGYSQMNMMQKIRFKPNKNLDIQYGFHYSETSDYSRYDRHIRYKKGLPRYGEWYYGPQIWMMNNLNVSHSADNFVYDQLNIRVALQNFEESRISRDINKFDRERRIEEVDAYSVNLDFLKHLGEKNELSYGFEYVFNDVTSTGINENIETGTSEPGPARYPQATWASYGAYISNNLKLTETFNIQAGLRYNQFMLDALFDTTFYPFPYTNANLNKGALTGSIGFVYRPTEKWMIMAGFATAFRSPNVDDLGKVFDSEPGSVMVPNPDLQPEYAYSADLGIAKMFGDFVKVDVTAYYTFLNNAMVRRDFTLNGLDSIVYDGEMSKVVALQNAAVANVYGLQAGLEINLPAGFGIASDFNYQKGEEELDDGTVSPSRHAAPWFGNSKLIYSANKLNMMFYAIYSGEKKNEELPEEEKAKTELYAVDENGNPYSPAWYTLNFKANYKVTENFSLTAGMENITDMRYRPYSSGICAPGRNFILSLKLMF